MMKLMDAPHSVPDYRGTWSAAVINMTEAVEWLDRIKHLCWNVDGHNGRTVQAALRDGDLEMANAAEKYISAFGDMTFEGRKFQTVDAIAGGCPNIAAHLAGSPLSMRQRRRTLSDVGALTVFVDGSSSGDIGAEDLKKRGAALLGLIQMLKAVRPVELYVVGGGTPGVQARRSSSVFVKIDGTMDLSRDGFAVAHPAFTRSFLYRASADLIGVSGDGLGWELGGVDSYREHALRAFCNVIGCDITQSIFFSPPHSKDPVIGDPVKWIKEMFDRHKGAVQ